MPPDPYNLQRIAPIKFLKIIMYAVDDKIFLKEETTEWSWISEKDDIRNISKGRIRSFKQVKPLNFNIKNGGELIKNIEGSNGGNILNKNSNEFVYAENSQIHFTGGGYIEILPPKGAEGKDVRDPGSWDSRLSEDIKDRLPEDVSASLYKNLSKSLTGIISASLPEDMSTSSPEGISTKFQADLSESLTGIISESLTGIISENLPEITSVSLPEDLSESLQADLSASLQADLSASLPSDMSESLYEDLSRRLPEIASASVSRAMGSAFPFQSIPNPQGDVINSVGRNIYIEVEFSAEPQNDRQFSPLIFYEQDIPGFSSILLAEKQEPNPLGIDHYIYWKMIGEEPTRSNPYKIDKLSDPTYLLTVNLDLDRYLGPTNSPQAQSPYFEILADAIPIGNIKKDYGESLLGSEQYPFNFKKYPYIGYAKVESSLFKDEKVKDNNIEEYTFEGSIKRLVFDPNAVCPC